MIQRIQTIYLLIVTVLSVVCLCLPVGSFMENDTISEFYNLFISTNEGAHNYAPWALFVLLLFSAALSFFTIFLFKKRMLQIRFCIFNIILNIGYYATFIAFIFLLKNENQTFAMNWPVCLPFASIILNWLAIRAIGKDEMLVKAYDRLR